MRLGRRLRCPALQDTSAIGLDGHADGTGIRGGEKVLQRRPALLRQRKHRAHRFEEIRLLRDIEQLAQLGAGELLRKLDLQIADGGSMVTQLSGSIAVNKGSTLRRRWVILNDPTCPVLAAARKEAILAGQWGPRRQC